MSGVLRRPQHIVWPVKQQLCAFLGLEPRHALSRLICSLSAQRCSAPRQPQGSALPAAAYSPSAPLGSSACLPLPSPENHNCRQSQVLGADVLPGAGPVVAVVSFIVTTGSRRFRTLLCCLAQLCAVAAATGVPIPQCNFLRRHTLVSGHCVVHATQRSSQHTPYHMMRLH